MSDYTSNNLGIKNRQHAIAVRAWGLTVLFGIFMILPFLENNFFTGSWALSLIALFLVIVAMVTALLFAGRSRKMKKLMSGKNLLAQWQLDKESLKDYVDMSYQIQRSKNKTLLWIMSIFFVLFTIIFLLILEDDDERVVFLSIIFSVFIVILAFGILMPFWYRFRNQQGDGLVLIGSKYLYVNGGFHNWDYPLSGLKKLQTISKPYNGIYLVYYYTDRTGENSFEIKIPVPDHIDTEGLISRLEKENS